MNQTPSTQTGSPPSEPARLEAALARIDAAHREDPHREVFAGQDYPAESLYAQRMTHWLLRLAPEAGEALRLAARCQHFRRWTIPRSQFPMDRDGYLQWRTHQAHVQAENAGVLLREVGYDEGTVARVQALMRKEQIKLDPETQLLEDVVGLVFVENYLTDFVVGKSEEKVQTVLRKTWAKMSPRGRQTALSLDLPAELRTILQKALNL